MTSNSVVMASLSKKSTISDLYPRFGARATWKYCTVSGYFFQAKVLGCITELEVAKCSGRTLGKMFRVVWVFLTPTLQPKSQGLLAVTLRNLLKKLWSQVSTLSRDDPRLGFQVFIANRVQSAFSRCSTRFVQKNRVEVNLLVIQTMMMHRP